MLAIDALVKKSLITGAVAMAIFSNQVQAQTLEQRIDRLERMSNNPVLLDMTRKLNDQEREIQNLQDQVDRLKRDISLMPEPATVPAGNVQNPQSGDQVTQLQQMVVNLQAQLKQAVDKQEVQAARLIVLQDDLRKLQAQGGSTVAANPASTSPKVETPEQPTVAAQAEPATATPVMTPARPELRPATAEEQKAYQAAFGLMRNTDYAASVSSFGEFIEKYPQSDLLPNAYYWRAEGMFIDNKYEQALEVYSKLVQLFPESSKASDAMLRAGDCLTKLKRNDDAKKVYQRVVEDFPDSRAASNATKILEKM
ncbi:Cell division coordinator CpoB [uncultured Thiomicrorhabdus sp.]